MNGLPVLLLRKLLGVSVASTLLLLAVFHEVYAQKGFELPKNPRLSIEDLPTGIAGIVKVALGLVAVIALAFIVYGGFRYITARGDEAEVKEAKNIITYAVLGILLIGIAYAIVEFTVSAVIGK